MTSAISIPILAVVGSFFSALLGFLFVPHSPSRNFIYRRLQKYHRQPEYSRLPTCHRSPGYIATSRDIPLAKYCPPQITLTKAERLFCNVLEKALGDTGVIFAKVPVVNVLTPAAEHGQQGLRVANDELSDEHFDFVVCAADGSATKLAIQLYDAANASASQQACDQFLLNACESAGLPLLQVRAARGYAIGNLKEQLAAVLPVPTEASSANLPATH